MQKSNSPNLLSGTAKSRLKRFIRVFRTTDKDEYFVSEYVKLVERLERNHGRKYTISTLKNYQLWIRNRTMRLSTPDLPFHKVIKDGVPKVFKPFAPLLDGGPEKSRFLNTMFGAVKCIRDELDYSTETITAKRNDNIETTSALKAYCLETPKLKNLDLVRGEEIPLRSKAGPNGPAIISVDTDSCALNNDKCLLSHIVRLSKYTLTHSLSSYIQSQIERVSAEAYKGSVHSSIRFLSDKSGKTRVIAVGDFWTQLTLMPIHNAIIELLSKIKSDATFRQDAISDYLRKKTSEGLFLGTADSTAFTDRLDASVQRVIVGRLFNSEIAQLWFSTVTQRDFSVKTPNGIKTLRYEVGQPMGFYSSWAVATLTHHIIVSFSAQKAGKANFQDYIILGDDIAIGDAEVYKMYLSTIKGLGISINPSKSTVSSISGEAAKRYFIIGKEVTGAPLESLYGLPRTPHLLIQTMSEIYKIEFQVQSVKRILDIMPKRLHASMLLVASAPKEVGGNPELFPDGLTSEWPWCSTELDRAFKKVTIRRFKKELDWLYSISKDKEYEDLVSKIDKRTRSQLVFQEDHPLVIGLGNKVINYLETLNRYIEGSLADPSNTGKGNGSSDFNLMKNAPISTVYTHKSRRDYESFLLVSAIEETHALLKSGDSLSQEEIQEWTEGIFERIFEAAQLRGS